MQANPNLNKENIIGKTICASITFFNELGEIDRVIQNCGVVETATSELIEYKLLDKPDSIFSVPAFYDEFEFPNKDLVYYLNKETNEPVQPDLIITLSVYPQLEEQIDD
ncbi:MAG: hypothetical protein SFU25_09835 [Candidatus Caenarcaniphilales bacterium]|nr:hypothetical protein [Candidatus Caenarcaniphilales bacterium]